jgi:predicted dehydrogenase
MGNKKKVLILGCGNIGALYDFKKEGVKTHAKAFAEKKNFDVTVFDQRIELGQEIASHYGFRCIEAGDDINYGSYDASTIEQLDQLNKVKQASKTRVLVNYFRRFQPAYSKLRDYIRETGETVTNIQLTYQRGFLNNATHGLDLLDFLFDKTEMKEVKVHSYVFDEFDSDPTLTLTAKFGDAAMVVQGLQNVKHSFFELKLWFTTRMISITENGAKIETSSAGTNSEYAFYLPLSPEDSPFKGINAIDSAMRHLVNTVEEFLNDPAMKDNFESSYLMNRQTLQIINSICPS